MADHESLREELLNILQAHGQEFLSSFSPPHPNQNKRKRSGGDGSGKSKVSKVTQREESEEEWQGFSGDPAVLDESLGSEERSDEGDDQGWSPYVLFFLNIHSAYQDLSTRMMVSQRMRHPAHPTSWCFRIQEQSRLLL
jgi:hypothetical protein